MQTPPVSLRKRIFFLGSTASGKSEWALEAAELLSGVIFNCDSIQVYKDLEIGSASPSLEDKERVPHFLFNYVSFPEVLTLGDYYRDFWAHEKSIPQGRPLFVVGGTGFYFRALEKGLLEIPPVPPSILSEIEGDLKDPQKAELLYAELLQADPLSSRHIHINDKYRLARALAVLRAHGRTPRQFEDEHAPPSYDNSILKVGIQYTKEELLPRVRARVSMMVKKGLIDEVERACLRMEDQGIHWKDSSSRIWKPLEAIGYRETVDFLRGNLHQSLLEEEIVQQTMKLIKKQKTWFQRDPKIHWFRPTDKKEWIVQARHFFLEDES